MDVDVLVQVGRDQVVHEHELCSQSKSQTVGAQLAFEVTFLTPHPVVGFVVELMVDRDPCQTVLFGSVGLDQTWLGLNTMLRYQCRR